MTSLFPVRINQGALEAGAADGAWQRAAKALDEAARKSEEERPDVEQSLALLRCSAPCRLALELDVNGAKQRVDATVSNTKRISTMFTGKNGA